MAVTTSEAGGYRKSSRSVNNGACVEVGQGTGAVVRDTKAAADPDRVELRFAGDAWRAFARRVKAGGVGGAGEH